MQNWVKNTGRAALTAVAGIAIGSMVASGSAHADTTSGDFSILGGNQVNAPISVPINLSGNAASLLGAAHAASTGGAHVNNVHQDGGTMHTSGKWSIGGGNQVRIPVSVPINLCGNSIAAGAVTKAACTGSAVVNNKDHAPGMYTSGKFSILGGNQVNAPISAPINACGNAVSVLGVAKAYCSGSATVNNLAKETLPSTSRKLVKTPLLDNKTGTKTSTKTGLIPSTKRLAGADEMPEPAKTLRALVRSVGVPVPGEDNAESFRPGLTVTKGLPVAMAGNPILR
ncbi:chaplin family protein [Spirillospora sp. CA-294931]|uniref:chaplin family protein n=1 Tax=Spirillospora sp. CA-294931 TaxID=3240042 RepID=UPI003D8A8139